MSTNVTPPAPDEKPAPLTTRILEAHLHEDDEEVLSLLDRMLLHERTTFLAQIKSLVTLVDDRNECWGCQAFIDPSEQLAIGRGKSREVWHVGCYAVSLEGSE